MPTPEQEQIVDAASTFLRDALPASRFVGVSSLDDATVLPQLGELGWLALALPEAAGGTGLGLVEEALVHLELGRAIAPLAVLGAALAARVASQAGHRELCKGIATGTIRVGIAVPQHANAVDGDPMDGPVVLFDAGAAGLFVSWNPERAVLWSPPAPRAAAASIDPGVGMRMMDGTTQSAVPHGIDAPGDTARLAAPRGPATPGVVARGASVGLEASVLIAAHLCGVAEAARDLAVEYAKTREQFGKPIGAFQAVKHPCADAAVACEAALCLLKLAALSVVDGHPDAALQAASAKLVATDAALANARACVQIHGGMGITAECAAHLFVKRAHVLDALGGDRREQQRRILAHGR